MSTPQADTRYAPPGAAVADVAPPVDQPPLATRWRRLGGSLIDGLLLGGAFVLVALLVGRNVFKPDPAQAASTIYLLGNVLIGIVVFLLLNGYLLATRGQTVAKLMLGMRIVRPDGGKASVSRVILLRYLLGYAVNIIPVAGGLYALVDDLLIFRQSRRCLHDQIADTIVIRV